MADMTLHPAFSDTRAFLLRNDNPKAPKRTEDAEIIVYQSELGPHYIQVGKACTDARLREAWVARSLFPELRLSDLIAIRDDAVNEIQVR